MPARPARARELATAPGCTCLRRWTARQPDRSGDFGWRRPVLVSQTRIAGGAALDTRVLTWKKPRVTRHRPRPSSPAGRPRLCFRVRPGRSLIHSNVALVSGPMLDTSTSSTANATARRVMGGINPGDTISRVTPVPADFQVNQYTTTPFDARQYDENGNLRSTTPTGPNGVSRTMGFDYANRLVSALLAGGLQAQYRYDALGRRIQRDMQAPGPPSSDHTLRLRRRQRDRGRDSAGALLASYAQRIPQQDLGSRHRATKEFDERSWRGAPSTCLCRCPRGPGLLATADDAASASRSPTRRKWSGSNTTDTASAFLNPRAHRSLAPSNPPPVILAVTRLRYEPSRSLPRGRPPGPPSPRARSPNSKKASAGRARVTLLHDYPDLESLHCKTRELM